MKDAMNHHGPSSSSVDSEASPTISGAANSNAKLSAEGLCLMTAAQRMAALHSELMARVEELYPDALALQVRQV